MKTKIVLETLENLVSSNVTVEITEALNPRLAVMVATFISDQLG